MKLLVINGVNLNMLGIREPSLYGKGDYKSLVKFIKESAKNLSVSVKVCQFNTRECTSGRVRSGPTQAVTGLPPASGPGQHRPDHHRTACGRRCGGPRGRGSTAGHNDRASQR